MEKGNKGLKMSSVQSDLSLISKIKEENDEKSLLDLNKKKRTKEFFIDDTDNYLEPSCESFIPQIDKEEAFSLFEKYLKKEKDTRVKKIIDIRYNGPNNKLTPWRIIAEKLNMSIQGCINIHNRFINKIKIQTKYV